MYQQGDVLMLPVGSVPTKAKKLKHKVLAEGETTGHAHRVKGDAALFELGDKLFLRVLAGNVRVVHEEHKEIELPVGDYEVRGVQEYDHFAEEARRVAD